jgi:two-component system, NarL family, nitrate/nitrite response regulator NarL
MNMNDAAPPFDTLPERVLLADDHRLIAEAVAAILTATGQFAVDIADSFDSIVEQLQKSGPFGLVLLDLRMPGMNGIESVQKVVDLAGDGFVVLFSSTSDRPLISKALEVGVRGLIPKSLPLKSLVSVISVIQSGQTFLPVENIQTPQNDIRSKGLSDIEISVLKRTAAGMTNKEIARDIGTTETMIKMHMRSICKKLGARNRARAAIIGQNLDILAN